MKQTRTRTGGILTGLRRDASGNALAMTAAMIIPLVALSGSAIDISRLYVIKARLQQACDAGALAGRKAMTNTTIGTTLEPAPSTQANTFFDNNFRTGWFSTTATTRTWTKATVGTDSSVANAVSGAASTQVPMTIMSMFGSSASTLNVTCQALYDLADTDVMFILDNTGSMSATPTGPSGNAATYTRTDGNQARYQTEQAGSKIQALRDAVVLFDSTMTSNKQADTNIRYGFAPYSEVVNIGKLLPTSTISGNLSYNSRGLNGDYDFVTNATSATGLTQAECTARRTPVTGFATGLKYKVGSTATTTGYYGYISFTGTTSWSTPSGVGTCTGPATIKRPMWKYGLVNLDVAQYAALNTVATPGRLDGTTSKWRGCVELTDTSAASTFNASSLPSDLDPDVMPNWRPMWPEAVWKPQGTAIKDENVDENYSYKALGTFETNQNVTCPMEAKTLSLMTATAVQNYVNNTNFKAAGYTYHDYGMSWGLRMLSKTGPFAASVAPPSGRKAPTQNIVFMTDGDPQTNTDNYQLYGIEALDKRITGGAGGEDTKHSARFRALCDAAKARGITVYMIAFGTALTADMNYCASPGQAFTAADNATLQTAFTSIARRIAMLRISL
ncbi:TadE/TadG family type IV pilus assembly protein [Sphingomonas sp.]|uniref:TadE/TadG family type IV pilus assembly protein n=1 Tax=Sphingomonas sp. TaxID=28214 RepID=UPI0025D624AE|nr:TadE/TadG family type IV pilus assembly protein [Sphingomonas sp.]